MKTNGAMSMRIFKTVTVTLMLLIFLSGMGIFLYPSMQGHVVDNQIQHDAEEFLSWVEIEPTVPDSFENDPTEPDPIMPARRVFHGKE